MKSPPPEDAYGRITDSERFRPLHEVPASLLASLQLEYDVDLSEEEAVEGELASRSQ